MSELPSHFKELVAPLGLDTIAQWGPSLYKQLRTAWEDVYVRARELKPTKKHLNVFAALLVSSDKKRMESVGSSSDISQDAIFKLLCEMFPRYFPNPKPNRSSKPKPKSVLLLAKGPATTPKKRRNNKSGIVQIGFGLESTYRPKRIDPESVVVDEHTTPETTPDKSIIYTPGWSINGAFDDKS